MLATPLFVARSLCSTPSSALLAASERVSYAPWLVANLLLEAPLLERATGATWPGTTCGTARRRSATSPRSTRACVPMPRATVLTAYWALAGGERAALLDDDWRPWAQRVIDDLAVAHPDLPGKVPRVELMRHGHAMRIPVPGARGDPALAALREARAVACCSRTPTWQPTRCSKRPTRSACAPPRGCCASCGVRRDRCAAFSACRRSTDPTSVHSPSHVAR